MKKVIVFATLFLAGFLNHATVKAQVNVQVNIQNQPGWGPIGYDYVEYYYFPDYNFYYDVVQGKYLIYSNSKWIFSNSVPSRYRFDPFTAYKVVVNERNPYLRNKFHQREYNKFKGNGGNQPMIRDSKDNKYHASKGHPEYNKQSPAPEVKKQSTPGRQNEAERKNETTSKTDQSNKGQKRNN